MTGGPTAALAVAVAESVGATAKEPRRNGTAEAGHPTATGDSGGLGPPLLRRLVEVLAAAAAVPLSGSTASFMMRRAPVGPK